MIEKVIAEKSRQYSERVIELISEHREFTTTRLVEQIDGQSDIRTIAGIVDDPKYFRFADSTFSGRSVQFRLERVVFRLGNLSLNSDIIYNRNVRKRRPIVFSENSCPRNHDS